METENYQAKHLLRVLPYEEWLGVGTYFPPKHINERKIKSVEDLRWFLKPSPHGIPAIKLDRMVEWIEKSVGDRELAEALAPIVSSEAAYLEKCFHSYEIIAERCDLLSEVAEGGRDA